MVRLLKPQEGMRIYDPCVGSGGMLIQSNKYVEEHGGDPPQACASTGRTTTAASWAICKMNMILHGIPDADIQNDDTLADPDAPRRRRADALRPGDQQSPVQPELHSGEGWSFPERFR